MCEMTDMTWGEDDKWTSELTLSPGSYEFKLVILREDGSVAAWEPGENRTVTVSLLRLSSAAQLPCLDHTKAAIKLTVRLERGHHPVSSASGAGTAPMPSAMAKYTG